MGIRKKVIEKEKEEEKWEGFIQIIEKMEMADNNRDICEPRYEEEAGGFEELNEDERRRVKNDYNTRTGEEGGWRELES